MHPALLVLCGLPSAVFPANPGHELPDFELPAGLQATLWAESPRLYNPTAMDVDARGRIWVTEAVNYRRWDGRNPGRTHPEGDRVVILEDSDGDGRCDSSKVFAQDADLVAPLGIAVVDERRVIVSCSPSIFVYTDVDGDDRADEREVFLTGFGGPDHDHGVHSIVPAVDGSWYLAVGNAGPCLVTDRSGWSLRSGSLYTGGGPRSADNKPGLVSDDGRVWTGGLVLRIQPDGTGLEVLAHNFRNNYEVALDSFGNLFQSDNDDDGNESCRTLWVMEGGNHGYFSADGSRTWNADRRPGQSTQTAHWHQDDPGVVPAGTINGAGGPTGVVVYEGELLGESLAGRVLNADAGRNCVYAHRPVRRGAGFELEPGMLIAAVLDSDERAHWFRPSDVVVGTDGAVYVADWYDPGVGGHLAGDAEAYGRIVRIAPEGDATPPPVIDLDSLEGRLAALRSPAVSVRARAARALADGDPAAIEPLAQMARAASPRVRARAVAVLAGAGPEGVAVVEAALTDPEPELRVAALRALARTRGTTLPWAAALAEDPSPAVRCELMLSLRDEPLEECEALLLELARGFDGRDRYYLEAFGIAAEHEEAELFALLAAELGEVPGRWDERFAGLAWRLHPAAAIPAFEARARDVGLPAPARRQAVDALAFIPEEAAAEAMVSLALTGPPDVRLLAGFWVEHRDSNDWRAFGLREQLAGPDLEQAEERYASGIVTAGMVDVDVDVSDADKLWLVVTSGERGNSCDWADWIEPCWEDAGGLTPATDRPWLSAEAEWGSVRVGANAAGGPVLIDSHAYRDAIGTHAYSVICYEVPEGARRFRTRAGVDDGGTGQGAGITEVEFKVLVATHGNEERLDELEALLDGDSEAAANAARELASDPQGGLRLVHLAETDRLDRALRPVIGEVIFKNPDPSVRALASGHFPRADGHSLPPVAELAALEGDPRRGRELFFATETQCTSCHAVRRGTSRRGQDVGPELTNVRAKYGKTELLDAILNPSAAIAFGYDTWMLVDTDGRVFSGFLLADGEDVVLKDTQGKRHVLAAEDIAERHRQELSTMPEGVALGLEPQDLADLCAFLLEDPDEEPVLGPEVDLLADGLEGWAGYLADPDAGTEDVWSFDDGVLVCKGEPVGYLRTEADYTNFVLSLEWRFDPEKGPGNSGVLLRLVGEDKVWPRSIEAQLQHENAGDIWNIDRFGLEVDPARTSGRRTARMQPSSELPLGEWNRYVITLDRGELRLEVNGVLQNRASWCDEVPGKIALQSEGAEIQFRNVRLRTIEH